MLYVCEGGGGTRLLLFVLHPDGETLCFVSRSALLSAPVLDDDDAVAVVMVTSRCDAEEKLQHLVGSGSRDGASISDVMTEV